MHPIWFAKWVWERAWSEDGLFTLVEHNQGFLSLVALAVALWAFLEETRRANEARQSALQAEADGRTYREEAERRARLLAFEVAENEARAARDLAVEAERRGREAERRREALKVQRYEHAVERTVIAMREAINTPAVAVGTVVRFEHAHIKALGDGMSALNSMLSAVPLDAAVILAMRELIAAPAALHMHGGDLRPAADLAALVTRTDQALDLAEDHFREACRELRWMIANEPDPVDLFEQE